MSTESTVEDIRRSHSLRWKRAGTAMLAGIVVVYLALIVMSFSDRLNSTSDIVLFVFLLCIGLLALVMLFRMWRGFSRLTTTLPPREA